MCDSGSLPRDHYDCQTYQSRVTIESLMFPGKIGFDLKLSIEKLLMSWQVHELVAQLSVRLSSLLSINVKHCFTIVLKC